MPLRFRSFAPYTLPGVLALLGWWWYISRKKARPNSLQAEEEGAGVGVGVGVGAPAMGLLSSPSEGSNGLLEKACCQSTSPTSTIHRRPSKDRPKAPESKTPEQAQPEPPQQEVVVVAAQVHSPLGTTAAAEPKALSVSASPSMGLGKTAEVVPQQSPIQINAASQLQTPTTDALSTTGKSTAEQPQRDAESSRDRTTQAMGDASVITSDAAHPTTASAAEVCAASDRVGGLGVDTAAELTKDKRPEPEGEVAAEEIPHSKPAPTPTPAQDTQRDVAPCTSSSPTPQTTKDDVPASARLKKSASESVSSPLCPHPETPTAHLVITSPLFTSTPTGGAEEEEDGALPSEGGKDEWHSTVAVSQHHAAGGEGGDDCTQEQQEEEEQLEFERVAAGLITEIISAAAQEVQMSSCEGTSDVGYASSSTTKSPAQAAGTPVLNGRPYSATTHVDGTQQQADEMDSPAQQSRLQGASRSAGRASDKEMANGCLTSSPSSSTWEYCTDRTAAEPVKASTSKSKAQAAEDSQTAGEDSGCYQSEDGMSSDVHSTAAAGLLPSEATPRAAAYAHVQKRSPTSSLGSSEVDTPRLMESPSPMVLEEAVLARHEAATALQAPLTAASLRNGGHMAGSEAEADQSGGSDVNSMDSVDSGCTLGASDALSTGSQPSASSSSEMIVWEIEVPKHLVGRLIGKQGRYVSFLKQSSGAKIYISTLPYTQEFQICHMEGSQQQVDKALALIGKKFKDLDLTNLYAPPAMPLSLPSLPMTSWLLLPNGVTVEVIVVNIVSPGHMFVQQHTHPTYHALRSLDQQMFLCYSQPGTPALPTPIEVGVICAAPAGEGSWWRAQVISFYKDANEVEIRYVDYGGYERVKIDTLRQIRSDFVSLPFQGTEVLLDNLLPLPGEDRFSTEGNAALEEMTRGVPLLAQVTNYDNNTGLPMVQMWNMVGEECVLLNRTLAERGFGTWVDNF